MLYSLAREFHTALASHSGESSVNGDIVHVINPRADISALAERVTEDSHVVNATAQSVQIPVSSISDTQFAYKAPTESPVSVRRISQIPVEDTTRESSALAERVIDDSPTQFTPITAFHVPDRLISVNATT